MIFNRLIKYLKPYKKSIFIAFISIITSSICLILSPKILGDFITSIYQSIVENSPIKTNYLYKTIVILSSLYLINIISNYLENYLINNACQKALYAIRNETMQKLSKLELKYFDTHSKGEILSHFNNDLEMISYLFTQTIPKVINYSITFIGILIMMFFIDSILTLITLITLPLLFLTSKLLLKFSKNKRIQYLTKLDMINSIITESYLNKEIISLYNRDELMSENFDNLNKELAKTNIKATLITSFISPISTLLNYLVYLIILVLGAKHVLEGKLKFGEIQTLIQYTKQIGAPINNFSSILSSTQNALLAGKRIFKILDEVEEKHFGSLQLTDIETIEFKNVSFSYDETPFIENLNLKINKGEKIALIGETGSGKTTIVNLLMQFYKIKQGEILINNNSIYEYDINSFYNQTSLITQDLWLLNDTIENNLKYGNFQTNKETILNISKSTNCLDIINKTPNKLEEIIDENNQNISEGEKQLITITRALIKKHNLLILDEATSNLDFKSEKLFSNTLKNLDNKKITIMVAHKLSTITKADKIIVMKQGKIIECGTHTSLYNKKGEYYDFLQTL